MFNNAVNDIDNHDENNTGQELILQQVIDYERMMRCVSNPTDENTRINYIEGLLINYLKGH